VSKSSGCLAKTYKEHPVFEISRDMFSMTNKVCTTFPLLKLRNSSSKKIVVIPKFDHEKLEVLEDKQLMDCFVSVASTWPL